MSINLHICSLSVTDMSKCSRAGTLNRWTSSSQKVGGSICTHCKKLIPWSKALLEELIRGCTQKFPDWVDNEIYAHYVTNIDTWKYWSSSDTSWSGVEHVRTHLNSECHVMFRPMSRHTDWETMSSGAEELVLVVLMYRFLGLNIEKRVTEMLENISILNSFGCP
jgi:hypothetical protein